MLLLDRVLTFEAATVVCSARPTHDSIFARAGVIPAVALLEYMAQAAAACLALGRPQDRAARGLGLLVAARRVAFTCAEIAVDTELAVRAALTATAGRAASFECSVEARGVTLTSAELTVVLSPEPA